MVVRACRLLDTNDKPDLFTFYHFTSLSRLKTALLEPRGCISYNPPVMFTSEDLTAFGPHPFWFVSTELLADIWRCEIKTIIQLFSQHSDLCQLFDTPDATIPQRTICFELLAHRKVIEMIGETVSGRYEDLPPLSDEESGALRKSQHLAISDAPGWIREGSETAEWLPVHINRALPELLREQGFNRNDQAIDELIRSAVKATSTLENIQDLIQGVFDQQLGRLKKRWSAETVIVKVQEANKRKRSRRLDAQRINRDKLIAEIAEVSKTQTEFLQIMDERRVQPQPTWKEWPGSWTRAYKNPRLCKLIQQDKSRAVLRVAERRGR